MDDEAILAGLDGEPDAFAVFSRRHVAALLEHFASRAHDRGLAAELCAETFATALDDAHRFDPARGLAVDWLDGIARRLLNDAGRSGAVTRSSTGSTSSSAGGSRDCCANRSRLRPIASDRAHRRTGARTSLAAVELRREPPRATARPGVDRAGRARRAAGGKRHLEDPDTLVVSHLFVQA
jgi:DNA-directed RNA polymerase specialized sigma24 family protein